MRIAQAYGLGEFAHELRGLQDDDASGSGDGEAGKKKAEDEDEDGNEVDEQEEWNREVDEDWRRQEHTAHKGETVAEGSGRQGNRGPKDQGSHDADSSSSSSSSASSSS